MPARLINIKYITIRAEKVASPVTALHSETVKERVIVLILHELRHNPLCTFRLCLNVGINAQWVSVTYFLLGQLDPNVRQPLTPMRTAAIFRTVKSPYLGNASTDLHKTWHGNAYWSYPPCRPSKFCSFKYPRWRTAAMFIIEKSPYLGNGLTDRDEFWYDEAHWHLWSLNVEISNV